MALIEQTLLYSLDFPRGPVHCDSAHQCMRCILRKICKRDLFVSQSGFEEGSVGTFPSQFLSRFKSCYHNDFLVLCSSGQTQLWCCYSAFQKNPRFLAIYEAEWGTSIVP